MKSTPVALFLIALFAISCVSATRQGRRLLEDSKSSSSSKSSDDGKSKGSVKGDPILTAFDGQQFEFHGLGDHYYNLVSEPGVFQLSTLLKPAVMFDHNGTYMRGIAVQQGEAQVIVATGPDFEEEITVHVNGELLKIEDSETQSTRRSVPAAQGSLDVNWQLFAPGMGPYVEIRTASVKVTLSLTAPFADAGGVLQPNYLNANVTLLREPAQDLQGVLGETFNTLRAGSANKAAPKYPLFEDSTYELSGYFAAPMSQTLATLAKKFTLEKPSSAFLS